MKALMILAAAAGGIMTVQPAAADPIVLTGNYIRTAIGDNGTLGSGGSNSPGLIHDPTGTGTFDPLNDYITPGTPHQGFSLIADQFAFSQNDNDDLADFGSATPTLLTGAAANGYANAVSWTGGNRFLTITNSYFFNPGDQRILINTRLTALSNLTGLGFATSVDPDPDVGKYGEFDTVNQRGNSVAGVNDFIGSAGAVSGLVLGLLNIDAGGYAHSTQINADCCRNINPFSVLNHVGPDDLGLSATGDFGLNLAYNIGALSSGSTASLTYAYAVGDRLSDTGAPDPTTGPTPAVPEPATWAFMTLGLGAVGGTLRRRRRNEAGALRLA